MASLGVEVAAARQQDPKWMDLNPTVATCHCSGMKWDEGLACHDSSLDGVSVNHEQPSKKSISVVDPGFSRLWEWVQTYCLAFFTKTAWKWKKLDREGVHIVNTTLGSANASLTLKPMADITWSPKWEYHVAS